MTKVNIGQAKELYGNFGNVFYLDELFFLDKLKRTGSLYSMPNDTYIHALFLTDWMFQKTNSSLKMLSGPTIEGFLSTIGDSFKEALRRIKAKGKMAQLIIAGTEKPPCIADIESEIPRSLEIKVVQPADPEAVAHFIVCDSSMIREEKPHPLLDDEKNIDLIKATVRINDTDRAKVITRKFDEIWEFLSISQ